MGKTATGRAEEDVEAAWAAAPQQEAWVAWLVPAFALANTIAFAYTMYVNDCPSSHRLLLGPLQLLLFLSFFFFFLFHLRLPLPARPLRLRALLRQPSPGPLPPHARQIGSA
uniref:Uncharacterized protein n=1 Tax=Ananas comosus var. bracteatus TaxID=296719 RepID=A0A6V7P0F7_ANACO|nr:unnamed protein product [Ananas comosus var. bracteatus]